METIALKKQDLLTAYNDASETEKKFLKKLFPSDLQFKKRGLEVQSFEDACETEGVDPNDPKFTTGAPDGCAYQRIKVFTKAINPEGFAVDYQNPNQEKWFPVFLGDKPGFRFFASYCWTFACSLGGSRMSFAKKILSDHAAKIFLVDYEKFYL